MSNTRGSRSPFSSLLLFSPLVDCICRKYFGQHFKRLSSIARSCAAALVCWYRLHFGQCSSSCFRQKWRWTQTSLHTIVQYAAVVHTRGLFSVAACVTAACSWFRELSFTTNRDLPCTTYVLVRLYCSSRGTDRPLGAPPELFWGGLCCGLCSLCVFS